MANKFEKKTYTNRQSQYPNRRKFIPTGIEDVYDVERQEGEVTDPGTAYDADTLNDIEQRVYNGFSLIDDTDITVTDANDVFTATKLDGVLTELFTLASNGKTAIANAIRGISSSSTFAVLAAAITSGKASITAALGSGTSDSTFADITGFINTIKSNLATAIGGIATNSTFATSISAITSGKTAIANAIGTTPGGTPTVNSTFAQMASLITSYKKTVYNGSFYGTSVTSKGSVKSYHVNINFGFVPTQIIVSDFTVWIYPDGYSGGISTGISVTQKSRSSTASAVMCGIDNISANGFDIWIKSPSNIESFTTYTDHKILAVG